MRPLATLHLRLLDGRPFFSVLVGACQFGTGAWAGLRLNAFIYRAPVGQGPSGPDWLAIALGLWSGRVLATGTAWAGLCLILHHHH